MRKPLIAALAVGFTALAFASPALSMPSTPTIEQRQINAGVIDVGYRDRYWRNGTAIAHIRMDMDIGRIIGPTVTTGPMRR